MLLNYAITAKSKMKALRIELIIRLQVIGLKIFHNYMITFNFCSLF